MLSCHNLAHVCMVCVCTWCVCVREWERKRNKVGFGNKQKVLGPRWMVCTSHNSFGILACCFLLGLNEKLIWLTLVSFSFHLTATFFQNTTMFYFNLYSFNLAISFVEKLLLRVEWVNRWHHFFQWKAIGGFISRISKFCSVLNTVFKEWASIGLVFFSEAAHARL